jgi:hypothetical protein
MRMIAGYLEDEPCGFDGGLCRSNANGMVWFAAAEKHRHCMLTVDGLKDNRGVLRRNDSISNVDAFSGLPFRSASGRLRSTVALRGILRNQRFGREVAEISSGRCFSLQRLYNISLLDVPYC